MLHENDKIKVHMIDWPHFREVKTRNYGRVFTVTKHPETGKLCIEWVDSLLPLTSFAWTVIFENIDSGKLYHNNAISGGVVELTPENDDLHLICAAGIT